MNEVLSLFVATFNKLPVGFYICRYNDRDTAKDEIIKFTMRSMGFKTQKEYMLNYPGLYGFNSRVVHNIFQKIV